MRKGMLLPLLLFPFSAPALADAPAPNVPVPKGKEPAPLQPAIRQMLDAAIATGTDADLDTVAKFAKQADPQASAEIDAIVNTHRKTIAEYKREVIQEANFTQLWKGRGELGGFRSTGSTSEIGISAGLTLQRTGLKWSHALTGSADYRRANGETSRERFFGSYQPKYQFDAQGFAYGLAQFERDPFIGYFSRYTGSIGVGYKLIKTKKIDLSVDVGPSVRHVQYVDGNGETNAGGRSSLDFNWKLTPTITIRQTASGYVESDVRSLAAQTTFNTRIASRLSANFSYNIQYETETPLTDERLDTLSKVTLVYDF